MGYYLVDYENVSKDGLNGIQNLAKDDTVCIFYSENADTLTFSLHRHINESKAEILFCKADVGTKNALDFQLATHLGYIIAMGKDREYFLVTKDNAFRGLCTYWAKRNINVSVVIDLTRVDALKEKEKLLEEVRKAVNDEEIADTVVNFIGKYKTKEGIHNALAKKYTSKDNKHSSEIYNAIKPLISNKKDK